jgi:hypothetical protein
MLDPRPIGGLDSQPASMLDALADAYARGDAPHGERLLTAALDLNLPWDQVCAAAATGMTRRYASRMGE